VSILHVSINADAPERVARFMARLMGGRALPFPPFPDAWIAFTEKDDGSAIEVYPLTHTLYPGETQIGCDVGAPVAGRTFVHAAIRSSLTEAEITNMAEAEGWQARTCNRGPFNCVEVWLENRLLVEVLDTAMQDDYARGMTAENWARMFGLK